MATGLLENLLPAATPPQEATAPGGFRFHLLLLAVSVAFGAWLQIWGPPAWSAMFQAVSLTSLPGVAALLAALFVSVVVHEMGHLSAALFLNYEVLGGGIGPFRYARCHRATMLRFDRESWFRCFVSAAPREIHSHWRICTILVIAAGPLFTLSLLAAAARLSSADPQSSLAPFWSSCAEVNFFLFLLGLIPNPRRARQRNDAALLLALWRNSSDALDIFTCHRAIQLSLRGIRPEDYPEALLRELAVLSRRPYTNLLVARRFGEWAMDSGAVSLACAWDRYALLNSKECGAREWNTALAESACLDVLFRDDLASALDKFAAVDFGALFPPALAERAKAAHLIACDLPNHAPEHILRAQYSLPPGIPYYDYERVLLHRLHAKALSQCLAVAREVASLN